MFSDTAGLFIGNDVGILGVKVGHVEKIEPEGPGVKVTMAITEDVKIPADAKAVLTTIERTQVEPYGQAGVRKS